MKEDPLKHAIYVLAGGFIGALLVGLYFMPPRDSGQLASWVQAFGSIGAIVAAIYVLHKQSKVQTELQEREWRKEEAQRLNAAISHVISKRILIAQQLEEVRKLCRSIFVDPKEDKDIFKDPLYMEFSANKAYVFSERISEIGLESFGELSIEMRELLTDAITILYDLSQPSSERGWSESTAAYYSLKLGDHLSKVTDALSALAREGLESNWQSKLREKNYFSEAAEAGYKKTDSQK